MCNLIIYSQNEIGPDNKWNNKIVYPAFLNNDEWVLEGLLFAMTEFKIEFILYIFVRNGVGDQRLG